MTPPALSPRHRFGIAFVGLARRWRRTLDAALDDGGFGDASWVPLIHLAESGGGICQRDLAARAGIDGSSLVRLLDMLSARGLIERRAKADDRRTNLVHLTEAGGIAVAEVRRILETCEAEMSASVADAEIALLLDVFERIAGDLEGFRERRV